MLPQDEILTPHYTARNIDSQHKYYQQQPLIMGVLNVTPDSFSDGGCYLDPSVAFDRAMIMVAEGADIIDIGGESTRPGALPISVHEELARVMPVIERLRSVCAIKISIDTYKAQVMQAAVAGGATMINDITALGNHDALLVAATLNVPICLMHMQGAPSFMQQQPTYPSGVVAAINDFFTERIATCGRAGIARERLILDPGFGFGKSTTHNLSLMRGLPAFQQHALPILLGVSRKSTIGIILNKTVLERNYGGLALVVFAALQGVSIIRTHDVAATYQALTIIDAIMKAGL